MIRFSPCVLALVGMLSACKGFSDPAHRGALMVLDSPRVPSAYHGLWADRLRNCGSAGDRSVQLRISATRMGIWAILSAEGYSDYQAVALTLSGEGGRTRRVFLDITDDGRRIRLGEGHGRRDRVLRRCPPPDLSWSAQARGACGGGDFALFFEAFSASEVVRRRYMAPRIAVSRPGAPMRMIARSAYIPPPIQLADYRYVLADTPDQPASLQVNFTALPDGRQTVRWVRAQFDDPGEGDATGVPVRTYGPAGTLVFRRVASCWRLEADNATGS